MADQTAAAIGTPIWVDLQSSDPDANLVEFYWGIDQIGWDSRPRAYVPIQEIDLEAFDFDAYVAEREAAAEQPQA